MDELLDIQPRKKSKQTARRFGGVLAGTALVVALAVGIVGPAGAVVTRTTVVPANTSAPTISGTVVLGQTLTAERGAWTGTEPITYTYEWLRCNSAGSHCATISGATGTTYLVDRSDVGHTLRVTVSARNAEGANSVTSAATSVASSVAEPLNTAQPTISGTAQEGQTLTADKGTWTGTEPISYSYVWQRCDSGGGGCGNISASNQLTYLLERRDVDHTFRVVVTARNAGAAHSATSPATSLIKPAVVITEPVNTVQPTISGTAQEGQTLTADKGTWTGTEPITYSFTWQRCDSAGDQCGNISGASQTTYMLQKQDIDRTLRVVVTARNAAATRSATSAATAVTVPVPAVTMTSSTLQVVANTPAILSGTISVKRAGESVNIQAQRYAFADTPFTPLTTVVTNSDGTWSYSTRPMVQTAYQATWNGATSPMLTIGVKPLVTFHVISGNRFSTTVVGADSFANRLVQFQRRSAVGQWVTLKRIRLGDNSNAIFRATLPAGTSSLRIAFSINQAGPGYLGGVSRTIVYHRG